MTEQPVNLAPIRAVAQVWASRDTSGAPSLSQHVNTDTFARYAADAIPVLCDEIVRLRAVIADMQVTPA